MRNLYIGHSYQKKTKSTDWLIELIRKHSKTLDVIWDEEWIGGTPISIDDILKKDYDRVFVFQLPYVVFGLSDKIPEKLVYIPMYDAADGFTAAQWATLGNIPIFNLSRTLHVKLSLLGHISEYAQYFPDPDLFKPVEDYSDLKGFFWWRLRALGWPTIKKLAAGAPWSRFSLHFAPDPIPGETYSLEEWGLTKNDIEHFNISLSEWKANRSNFEEIAGAANVFFASRPLEGIGMSYLEAMARGQCVVAPNQPTHSEYITHDISGLLYDLKSPNPLDFSRAARLGAAARRKVEFGYSRWALDLQDRIPEFLLRSKRSPKPHPLPLPLPLRMPRLGIPGHYEPRPLRKSNYRGRIPNEPPSIAIVTPSFNHASFLKETIDSVLGQNYPRLNYFVQDGLSQDESTHILDSYGDKIRWESVKDRGQAHAINLGFSRIEGDIMAYLNSDDLLLPGSLSYVARAFQKYPEVDFIYGHRIQIDENGMDIGRHITPPHDVKITNLVDFVPQETMFWRRRVWDKIGSFDENYQFALDWEFILRAQAAGFKFRRLPKFLGCFRIHRQQKSITMIPVHDREVSQLRIQYHGRDVAWDDIGPQIRPYYRRHVWLNFLNHIGVLRY